MPPVSCGEWGVGGGGGRHSRWVSQTKTQRHLIPLIALASLTQSADAFFPDLLEPRGAKKKRPKKPRNARLSKANSVYRCFV